MRSYHNKERGLTVATVAVTCLPCSSFSFSLSIYPSFSLLYPFSFCLSFLSPFRFPFLDCLVNENCDFTTIQNWVDASTFLVSFSRVFQLVFPQLVFAFTYCHLLPFCRWLPTQRSQAEHGGTKDAGSLSAPSANFLLYFFNFGIGYIKIQVTHGYRLLSFMRILNIKFILINSRFSAFYSV